MVSYQSRGGKVRTATEERGQALSAILKYVLIVGTLVTITVLGARFNPWADNEADAEDTCTPGFPDMSVFTTGSPSLDARLRWAIEVDESENRDASGHMVTHIWTQGNTQFTDDRAAELWERSVTEMPTPPDNQPFLSITSDGVIVPYIPAPEVELFAWSWVEVGTEREAGVPVTFTAVSDIAGETGPPVPVVTMPLSGDTFTPAIMLGENNQVAIVEEKPLCP